MFGFFGWHLYLVRAGELTTALRELSEDFSDRDHYERAQQVELPEDVPEAGMLLALHLLLLPEFDAQEGPEGKEKLKLLTNEYNKAARSVLLTESLATSRHGMRPRGILLFVCSPCLPSSRAHEAPTCQPLARGLTGFHVQCHDLQQD